MRLAIQIGNPVSFGKAVNALRATDGIVEQATEPELVNALRRSRQVRFF
jgi:threonine synthase